MALRTHTELTPAEFENFTFDLLLSAGLQNVVWRTPGSDVGRDIEGVYVKNDFSGAFVSERWYIECKRYSSSVDWPTIWSKISYAQNHLADFLLLVTNSNPSPQAESEITRWNASERRPKLRVWRGYEIERILASHTDVAAKYGLQGRPTQVGVEFLPLTMEITKIAQAAYTSYALGNHNIMGLEACAALGELVTLRMSQIRDHNRILGPLPGQKVPDYDWVVWTGGVGNWEDAGVRACISFLRYLWDATALSIQAEPDRLVIDGLQARRLTPTAISSLRDVCLWADLDLLECAPDTPRILLGFRN